MLAFQLHHAIGDARALCRLATEFWRLYEDPSALEAGLGGMRRGGDGWPLVGVAGS